MNIKHKVLSTIAAGAILSQFVATKASAQLNIGDWVPTGDFSNQTLPQIVTTIIQYMLLFAGLMAVIFAIWGGFQYITSAGDAEKAAKGRSTLINSIIGLVIVFMAWMILVWVRNTLL